MSAATAASGRGKGDRTGFFGEGRKGRERKVKEKRVTVASLRTATPNRISGHRDFSEIEPGEKKAGENQG
jgi:hypothetical protein